MKLIRFEKMKAVLLLIGLSISYFNTSGQTVQNLNAFFANGKVTVTYDVVGAKPNQTYSINLYGSHDNFASPLKQVTGDVGNNIMAGFGKRIIWDATAELGTYSGQLSFKVKGEMNALPFVLKTPVGGGKVKRGKNLNIGWEGGRPDQNVKLTVFKGNDQVQDLGETRNTGAFVWSIPKKFEKGTYSIKLSTGQETKQSGFFTVKSTSPVLFIALPVVAVGAIIAVLAGGGAKKDGQLPGAPDPN